MFGNLKWHKNLAYLLARIALFHVSLVFRLAEKRSPKEVQKAKGSPDPGEENASFSEKSSSMVRRLFFRVERTVNTCYNDLNRQRRHQTCAEELELTASEDL